MWTGIPFRIATASWWRFLPPWGTSSEIATESATEIVSDTVTESATAGMTIDEEAASEIVGIIEGSGSKTQAIIDIAERLGVTYEEAEELLNAMLAAGDKYLGENELWIGFKRDIQENLQFWVIVIMCALAVLAIAGMIVVQLVKTNPTMRRSMRGTKEALAICETTQSQNSQTLTNLEKIWIKSVEKEAIYRELIEEKGRLEVIGRPRLFGTTQNFLKTFGITSLDALPSLDLFAVEG